MKAFLKYVNGILRIVMEKTRSFQVVSESNTQQRVQANLKISCAFKFYFDICYYSCLSPFRLKRDRETNTFIRKKYLPQTILCAVMVVMSLVWDIFDLRKTYPNNANSAIDLFHFFHFLFSLISKTHTLQVFWCHQTKIVEIVNLIAREDFQIISSSLQGMIYSRYTQIFLLLYHLMFVALSFLEGVTNNDWSTRMLAETQSALFITETNYSTESSELLASTPSYPASAYPLILLGCFTRLYSGLFFCVPDNFMFLIVLAMWSGANSFAKFVQTPNKPSWKQINSYYRTLLNLSSQVNHTLCFVPLWWIATGIFLVIFNVNFIILNLKGGTDNVITWSKTADLIYWLFTCLLFSYGCGDICSKVRYLLFQRLISLHIITDLFTKDVSCQDLVVE